MDQMSTWLTATCINSNAVVLADVYGEVNNLKQVNTDT